MEQQELWPENPKTTPPQAMPPENQSQNNNENIDEEVEVQVKALTGMLLRQSSCIVQLSLLLDAERQSNWVTPVMEVHLSSALLATVSLTMNTSDLLRTYLHTWKASSPILPSEEAFDDLFVGVHRLIEDALEQAHDW